MGLGDIFGGGGSDKPKLLEPAWQTSLRKTLSEAAEPGALERINRAGEPYPGDLTAALSGLEGQGYEGLEAYLNSSPSTDSDLFQSAKGELMKTLGGGYDPGESKYYKAYKTNLMRELQEAKDRLNASTSSREKYFGGGRVAVTGELEEDATGQLAQILGQIYENERVRRLGAVPEAMRMATYEEMAPLSRIEAALGYGEHQRGYEQEGLNREYSEWQRQLTDLGIPLDVALDLAKYRPDMYYPTYANKPGLFGGKEGVTDYKTGGDAQNIQGIAQVLARLYAAN